MMMDRTGGLALVLHAHLPYVRHPEHEWFLEENWLFEAITETYLPLLDRFERMVSDRVPFRLTLSLTPPLVGMLQDRLLQERYTRYIERLIELADREVRRTRGAEQDLARMYRERFSQARDWYLERYRRDLVGAFRRLQEAGALEILASAATHGFLPLLTPVPGSVRAQVAVGVAQYIEAFGRPPQGFWLPECAYYPGLDELLREFGLRYTILESHGVLHARPRPVFGLAAPIFCSSGLACFGRDIESGKQVWSGLDGYPGDPEYRDYYRDIGFDLDLEYIGPYLPPGGNRVRTGIKYHRITGKTDRKELYHPGRALERAEIHAGNFMFNRERQIEHLAPLLGRHPLILAPYDAELFGHWWFEGPHWLEMLLRKVSFDSKVVGLATPSEYLDAYPVNQICQPPPSSWGNNGYFEVWLNGENDWIYGPLHEAGRRLEDLVRRHPDGAGSDETARVLRQALRELLLAQSSDWAFILTMGTVRPYAIQRVRTHLENCLELCEAVRAGRVDRERLETLESRNNIFPNLDIRACLS